MENQLSTLFVRMLLNQVSIAKVSVNIILDMAMEQGIKKEWAY